MFIKLYNRTRHISGRGFRVSQSSGFALLIWQVVVVSIVASHQCSEFLRTKPCDSFTRLFIGCVALLHDWIRVWQTFMLSIQVVWCGINLVLFPGLPVFFSVKREKSGSLPTRPWNITVLHITFHWDIEDTHHAQLGSMIITFEDVSTLCQCFNLADLLLGKLRVHFY